MARQSQELIEDINDLVSLPDIYIRVKSVLDDPESSMVDLTEVVSFDPGLCARLLTLANSAFFGFSSKIDTIERAVNILGGQQIHDLVLATTVADAFSKVTPNSLNMNDFWMESVHCGLLAKTLAKECGLIDADRFFVEGLLYDLGHLVLDQTEPQALASAVAEARKTAKPLYLVEREMIGCDYSRVGAALMENWQFPGGFIEAVRHQNEPADAPNFQLDAAILHVSVCLLRADQESFNAESAFNTIALSAIEETGAEVEMLDEVVAEASVALAQTYEMLFPQARKVA